MIQLAYGDMAIGDMWPRVATLERRTGGSHVREPGTRARLSINMLQAGSAAHPVIRHVIHAATLLVVARRVFAVRSQRCWHFLPRRPTDAVRYVYTPFDYSQRQLEGNRQSADILHATLKFAQCQNLPAGGRCVRESEVG